MTSKIVANLLSPSNNKIDQTLLASTKDIDVTESAMPVDEESFQTALARAMALEPVQKQHASA